MIRYSLGLDFGTESVRALLVDVDTGEVGATAVQPYAHGVIDEALPATHVTLPHDWALQNPQDWLLSMEAVVHSVLAESGHTPEAVVGLGVDFTGSTILPTDVKGIPLCTLEIYRRRPHSWPKLWKHHAAHSQADRVNEVARARGESWLPRFGGKIRSGWMLPKVLQLLEEAPDIYALADRIVEGGDWIAWQLTGTLVRNACAAGYKEAWHKVEGFPSEDFLTALHRDLGDLYRKKLTGPILAPGTKVGGLTVEWARRLGLMAGTPVAASIVDAHAGVLGAGVSTPGTMFMMMGTSTCHHLMAETEVVVPGIIGMVEDGLVPGFFGYAAGQAGSGDSFAWFVEHAAPPSYHEEAARRGLSLHEVLAEKAALLRPGQSGLLALDWWNGNRSTLADSELSGMLIGCTLGTRAEHIYRALIEATAFGTRVIIEAFIEQGLSVEAIVAGGGLTKGATLMQIYSDVTGREMAVSGAQQISAHGAAILGAVAAGHSGVGYDSLVDAMGHMAPPTVKVYRPVPKHLAPYNILYTEYCRLYDYFGRGDNDVMSVLRSMRAG